MNAALDSPALQDREGEGNYSSTLTHRSGRGMIPAEKGGLSGVPGDRD